MTMEQDAPSGLRGTRRRGMSVSGAGRVARSVMHAQAGLPLVFTAQSPGQVLGEWIQANREELAALLLEHGALLFRGFAVGTSAAFEQCIVAGSGASLEYRFRASPRTTVAGNIYTSTDYPSDQWIFPHNEHSYSPVYPLHLYFHCALPSSTGGATPFGSTRRITAAIPPHIVEAFERRQILYVRNYGDGFGLPWPTVFQTDDRAEVERYCAGVGIETVWKSGDRLMTRQVGNAMVPHPQTGERLWFNHATFFNVSTLPPSIGEELMRTFPAHDMPTNTFHGDGGDIDPDHLTCLRDIYRREMTRFDWQAGDVVWLDNMLVVHGREPFEGQRRVLTGMAQAQRGIAIETTTEGT